MYASISFVVLLCKSNLVLFGKRIILYDDDVTFEILFLMEYSDDVVFNICPPILYCELYVFTILL